jgi:hypothetical protein
VPRKYGDHQPIDQADDVTCGSLRVGQGQEAHQFRRCWEREIGAMPGPPVFVNDRRVGYQRLRGEDVSTSFCQKRFELGCDQVVAGGSDGTASRKSHESGISGAR